jgi:cytochrome c heme-lyase
MSDTIGSTSAPCIDDISSSISSSNSNSNSNSNISSSNTSAGKCPVDLETRSLWSLLGRGKPARNDKTATSVGMSGTPIPQQRAIPASLEEAARHAQTPHAGQRLPLSTHRLESTIPRSSTQGSTPPAHQINMNMNMNTNTTNPKSNPKSNTNPNPKHIMTADTWVYPSEQQVFNAMKRKGWEGIEEESIPSFLQIHNSVNERSWREVQQWEGTFGDDTTGTVELSRFEGRPKDLTPKAWFLSTLGIRDKPFDRHDWYVVHTNNNKNNNDNNTETTEEKRYVLDFYMTEDHAATGVPKVEIDVRPALDSPGAFLQRGAGLLREVFPGITRELDERMTMMRNQR